MTPLRRLFTATVVAAGCALLAAGAASAAPGAPPDAGLVDDAAATDPACASGEVRCLRLASRLLGEERPVRLVLPESFATSAAGRRYPIALVLDGESNLAETATVAAALARHGQIPELLLVGVPNTDRLRDLTPPGLSVSGSSKQEGGDRFLDFLERELLPAVERQLRGAGPRVLIGHSSGGILATWAAASRPGFAVAIAIDTPTELGDGWLPRQLAERARQGGGRLRYLSYEARFGWSDAGWAALVAGAPPAWRLHREHLPGESHESMVMLATYLGLRDAFADYSLLAAPTAPTTSILPYYTALAESFGAPLVPPRALVAQVVDDLLAEGRGREAREAYAALVAGYGPPPDAAAREAQIGEVERRLQPLETVEALLAAPFPSPAAVQPFLGEWVGSMWMGSPEAAQGEVVLRLRVEAGTVVGETVHRLADGGERVQPWQHLEVTPQGLTWGVLNGMRPRAVALFAATLRGDTLSGEMRFAGVRLEDPPPPLHFAFTRRPGGRK